MSFKPSDDIMDDPVEDAQPNFREEEEIVVAGGDFSYTPYIVEDLHLYHVTISDSKQDEKGAEAVGVQFHSASPAPDNILQTPVTPQPYSSAKSEDFNLPRHLDELPDAVPNQASTIVEPNYSYEPNPTAPIFTSSSSSVLPLLPPPPPLDNFVSNPLFSSSSLPSLPPLPSETEVERHRILDKTSDHTRSLTINSVELVNPMAGGEEEEEEEGGAGEEDEEKKHSNPAIIPVTPPRNVVELEDAQPNSTPSPAPSSSSQPQRHSGSLLQSSTPTPSNPEYRPLPPRTGMSHKTLTPQDRAQFGTLSSHELNTPIDADSDEEDSLANPNLNHDSVSAQGLHLPVTPVLVNAAPLSTINNNLATEPQQEVGFPNSPASDIRFKYTPVEEEPGESKPITASDQNNGEATPSPLAAVAVGGTAMSYLPPGSYDSMRGASDAGSSYNYRYADNSAAVGGGGGGGAESSNSNPLSPYPMGAAPYLFPPSPYPQAASPYQVTSSSPYPNPLSPTPTPYSYAYFAPATADTPTPYGASPSPPGYASPPGGYEYKQQQQHAGAPYHHSIAQIGGLSPMAFASPYYNTASPYHVVQIPQSEEGEETPGEEREGHVRGEGQAEGVANPVLVMMDEKDAEVNKMYVAQEAARVAAALAEGQQSQQVVIKHMGSNSKQVQPEKHRLVHGASNGKIGEEKEEEGIELARAGSGYTKSPRAASDTKGVSQEKLKMAGLAQDAVLDADQLAALAAVEREEDDEYYQNMRREGESERKKAEAEKAKRRRERQARREAGGAIGPEDYVAVQPVKYWRMFTPSVIAIDIVLFVLMMHYNNWTFDALYNNPTYGPGIATLVHWGAKDTSLILGGDWWRLFAPIVLDAGIIQIAFVIMALARTSWALESVYGFHRLFVIWLMSGVFGEIISAIFSTTLVGVGASGAIYGLLGALFGDFLHTQEFMDSSKYFYFIRLIFTVSIGFILGLLPFVDNWAQIGGFIMGILTSLVLFAGVTPHPDSGVRDYKWPVVGVSLALVIGLYVGASVFLWEQSSSIETQQWCSYCHWVACIETSYWTCESAGLCVNATDPFLTYRNPDYTCP